MNDLVKLRPTANEHYGFKRAGSAKEMEPPSLNPLDEEGFLICTKSNVEGAIDCEKIFLDGFEYTILPYGGVQVVVSLTDNGTT